MTAAFMYIRFSSDSQAEGDSTRRQEQLRDKWLAARPGVKLAATYADEGVSGYSGAHLARGDLGRFIAEVDRGRVPHGSYFLCENVDRLSRLNPFETMAIVSKLVKAGINVVVLDSGQVLSAGMDERAFIMVALDAMRSHGESKRKSELIGAACDAKRRAAREHGTPKGGRVPFWLELRDGRYALKPAEADLLRRMYTMALTRGIYAIAREVGMHPATVRWALHHRAALGEWQPLKNRKPVGEPVPGHFPAAVSEHQWHATQAAIRNRDKRCGRPAKAKQDSLFSGLLWDVRDECSMNVITHHGRKWVVSSRAKASQGGSWRAFPLVELQKALLREMRELQSADLFADDPSAVRVAELATRVAEAERRLTAATVKWEAAPEDTAWQALVDKHSRARRTLLAELADAKQAAATPASAAWADIAEVDPERLRSALLATVDVICCVVVRFGRARYCAAQCRFKGTSETRTYVIADNGGSVSCKASAAARDFRESGQVAAWTELLKHFHES